MKATSTGTGFEGRGDGIIRKWCHEGEQIDLNQLH